MTPDERLADFAGCYEAAVSAMRQRLIAAHPEKARPGEPRDVPLLSALQRCRLERMDDCAGEGEC